MRGHPLITQGRRWAVLLCLPLLASCAQHGASPVVDTLGALWQGSDAPHRQRAEALPYASLLLQMAGNRSLVVLAYHNTGETTQDTYWQAQDHATLTMRDGRPYASAGFASELISLSYSPLPDDASSSAPGTGNVQADNVQVDHYRVSVHWQDASGDEHRADGQARLHCATPAPRELPLTTLRLEQCTESVAWDDGRQSDNTLWRDPDSQRLWAGDVHPWPDAPSIEWQVSRPWWTDSST